MTINQTGRAKSFIFTFLIFHYLAFIFMRQSSSILQLSNAVHCTDKKKKKTLSEKMSVIHSSPDSTSDYRQHLFLWKPVWYSSETMVFFPSCKRIIIKKYLHCSSQCQLRGFKRVLHQAK